MQCSAQALCRRECQANSWALELSWVRDDWLVLAGRTLALLWQLMNLAFSITAFDRTNVAPWDTYEV